MRSFHASADPAVGLPAPRAFLSAALLLLAAAAAPAGEPLPAMKFNEVRQVAPGVYFRFSAISATDKSVPFGGSNTVWVVFDDFVVVIDANFPKEAGDVIAAVKRTTDKPIRYVFDTHHHGDHAFGNAVFARAGASVIAQAHCARYLRTNGREVQKGIDARLAFEDILKNLDLPWYKEWTGVRLPPCRMPQPAVSLRR